METTFAALVAYGVFGLTSGLSLIIILAMQDGVEKLSPAQFQELAMQGRWYGASLIIACPPTLAVLWVAIRMAGRQFSEYLALNWPSRDELMSAFAVTVIILLAQIVLWFGEPSAHPLFTVKGAGGLLALLIGGCIAGPIMEEFVFRGFMFRGWSESSWSDRRDHSDVSVVGIVPHPIRLAGAFLDIRFWPRALHFSLAQRFNLAGGDRSLSR